MKKIPRWKWKIEQEEDDDDDDEEEEEEISRRNTKRKYRSKIQIFSSLIFFTVKELIKREDANFIGNHPYEEDEESNDTRNPSEYVEFALRKIRRFQKSSECMLPSREFQKKVEYIGDNYSIKGFTQNAYYVLLNVTEDYFHKWMRAANWFVIAKNSRIVTKLDFEYAYNVMNNK